jgi:exopolyphosphatase/pppGpp-phosphohydrolase
MVAHAVGVSHEIEGGLRNGVLFRLLPREVLERRQPLCVLQVRIGAVREEQEHEVPAAMLHSVVKGRVPVFSLGVDV